MHVLGMVGEPNLARRRQPVVACAAAVPRHVHLALPPGFLGTGLTPGACQDVVGGPRATPQEVHRHHGKLEAGAALQQQHLVVVANGEHLPQALERFLKNPVERGAPVADLEYRDAHAGKGEHFVPCPLQNLQRQHRGTGRKIVNTFGRRPGTAVRHWLVLHPGLPAPRPA